MRTLQFRNILLLLAALTLICGGMHGWVSEATDSTYYDFLLWNLFLAWLPLLFSLLAELVQGARRTGIWRWIWLGPAVPWLLMLPNSPYIVTDLIHLTLRQGLYIVQGEWSSTYWLDLLMILLFVGTGLLLGMVSLYQLHAVVLRQHGPAAGWLLVLASSLLSGCGILLGREHRLNSWDVLRAPELVLETVRASFTPEGAVFSLLFGGLMLLAYASFYFILHWGTSGKAVEL